MSLVTSSGMSFFSNRRVSALTKRIGTDGLREIVENLDNLIMKRVCFQHDSSWTRINFQQPITREEVTPDEARAYIKG